MKNWKAIVGVVLVFLLGSVAGGLVTARVFQRRIHQALTGGPQAVGDLIVRQLSWQLRLDAGQRDQLRGIVRDAQGEMQVVRKQAQPQVEAILDHAESEVRGILRADQAGKFDKLVAEQRAKWRR